MSDIVLQCTGLSKVFHDAGKPVHVFNNINFEVKKGESVAIIGRSGAGKSTFLQLMGGLDLPTSGDLFINGSNYRKLNEKQRSRTRNECLGFIYQFHHLLPEFTALENVAMPLLLGKANVKEAEARAMVLLEQVGLGHRVKHKVGQLSGGERQRIAIARALVNHPLCVLADEPTGNLDSQTAESVFETMLELNRTFETSLVIVTHDQALARRMDRVLTLENGMLV
jgi:lipoprotein-releasing system ATP-binding protein